MQGDIFQLNTLQNQGSKKPVAKLNIKPVSVKPLDDLVSIYNEDDLSHYLYLSTRSFDDLEVHNHATARHDHAHYLSVIASAFDDYCTDGPYDSSDDCAVYSDIDEDEYETTTPMSEVSQHSLRPRESFMAEEEEKEVGPQETPTKTEVTSASTAPAIASPIPCNQHVASIEGQLMSWWPLPVEDQEYDWSKDEDKATTTDQVSSIDGKLMSWWPLPVEGMEYDWNERFYE